MSNPEIWHQIAQTLRTGAYIVGGSVGALVLYRAGMAVYDDIYTRWRDRSRDIATLKTVEQQRKLNDIRPISADERGRYPLLYGANGVLRDPNNLRAFTLSAVLEQWPYLEDIDARIRAVIGAGGWPHPETAQAMIPEQVTIDPWGNLTHIPLAGLLDAAPSFHRIVLGVTVTESGQKEVVTADMATLVHVAIGGSSGWGKSVFLRALAYQLVKSTDPVDLAMIDLEGATLAPFATSDRLLFPVADTETDAGAILRELTQELDRRKTFFSDYPGVDSLYGYNERAKLPLDPLVCIIDEATALLEDKEIEAQLRVLALRARKYGLWVVLAGQDWKASSLDTAIRNQLATRIQFKAMSDSQSRVLLQRSGAEAIEVKGRAMAWIPGRDMITLQAPMIRLEDIIAGMSGVGPRRAMPQEGQSDRERILELARKGFSKRQIEISVYGYAGGSATRRVNSALEGATTVVGLSQSGAVAA